MAAYLIANITVQDATVFEEYRAKVPSVISAYGGRYLVRGGANEVVEGAFPGPRFVVLEFPDMAAARRFYHSADYAPLIAMRRGCTDSHVVLVEGMPPA
ncbi:MAG TPA: DUF1330 domain-containing protein [Acetobacteraceae bacterium]|nr:DUF1330 domain-containing protein [Acetobacteraceae bacterium]